MDKALFIPLKSEFYEAFERGDKDEEYRVYGPRWNYNTCFPGRPVILSKGYGKKHRMAGTISKVSMRTAPTKTEAWRKCYSDAHGYALCIRIAFNRKEA